MSRRIGIMTLETTASQSQQHLTSNENPRDSVTRKTGQNVNSDLRSITAAEWITVLILCFVNLINYMDRFTVAGVLNLLEKDFKNSNDESGLLQTAFIVSYMAFAPLFGYLGDRYNRKIIMSFGVLLWCLTTLIGSFMETYGWFLFLRMFVGVGEASYSTIAPTIISDLFVKDVRSKMLALFYFAIPVGSGLGYIIGGETARLTQTWQWGLRVTPALGIIAVILILTLIRDPVRGEKEGGIHVVNSSWKEDIKDLLKNPSFMLSTAGFTCVAFVAGALSWWGPRFIQLGLTLQFGEKDISQDDVSYKFGLTAMIAGLIGVPFGSMLAQKLRVRWPQADPLICAVGLLVSGPLVFFGIIFAGSDTTICYVLVFFGQLALNLNWSIVADMLLYVVIPTRRSTAEAFQILFAHALGDAGSPYLIGVISEALKTVLLTSLSIGWSSSDVPLSTADDSIVKFKSMQYALFITIFVEILGSLFFFLTALYIEKDKSKVDYVTSDSESSSSSGPSEDQPEINSRVTLIYPD